MPRPSLSLTHGDIRRQLISLTVPMTWGVFASMAFNLADVYFVGQLGTRELAAMSFTFPVVMVIVSLSIGLSAGTSSVVARAVGEGDDDKVRRLTTDSLMLSTLLVAVLSIAGVLSVDPVFRLLGAKEELPPHRFDDANCDNVTKDLPSLDDVTADKTAFARATRVLHDETSPFNARRLTQRHGDRVLVQNPPDLPLSKREMDAIYDLPYARRPHPRYAGEAIPAHEMIKDSVTIMRGCFGGCTFCSITMHQGRTIQNRSRESIVAEVERVAADPGFKGTISDIGGPTANMYEMRCTKPEVEKVCRRLSCIHPTICKLLGTSHEPTIDLMRRSRAVKGVKRVHVSSGIRMDLANLDQEYVDELAAHHVGGHLKVAPEHTNDHVLNLMKKPSRASFDEFAARFGRASAKAGKKQYLVPYFIASHPGSTVKEMIDLALMLKASGYRPRQVQDFIPAPMDVATCMFHTGLDPMTMKPVDTAVKLRDRKVQRALLQYFKPENWFAVRKALLDRGRKDLIGSGPLALIAATPPKEAVEARRKQAGETYVHAEDAGVSRTVGYRPGRKGHARRRRPRR